MPDTTPRGYPFPLYSDAADFPSQMQDLAEAVDTDVQSLYARLDAANNQPSVAVQTVGVNQAVAANTDVAATFTTEIYDNDAMANLGVSNNTITFNETGIWLASSRVTFLQVASFGARQTSHVTTGVLGTVGRKTISGLDTASTVISLVSLFFASAGNTMQLIQRSTVAVNTSTRMLQLTKVSTL